MAPVPFDAGSPSSCPAPPSCRVPRPGVIGSCELEPAPDGAACLLPCGSSGSCQSGLCSGPAASCDDSDACTIDSCSATSGCVHTPLSCAPPGDPCLAASCDPARGCVVASVADGTPCGPSDCETSRVCLSGACQTRPTPEGSSCGAWSPCQAPGVCRGQKCDRPAATPLTPVWSSAPATGDFDLPGIVDADGNLFWWESTAWDTSTLVSVDRDGARRYAVSVDLKPLRSLYAGDPSRGVLLAGSQLLLIENSSLFIATQARIEARDPASGALSWTHDFAPELKALHPCPGGGWEGVLVGSVSDDADTGLYVMAGHWCGDAIWAGNDLFFLDLRDGSTLWSRPVNLESTSVSADEDGNAYFLSALDELTSVDRAGALRFVHSAAPGAAFGPSTQPAAVFGGRFVTGTFDVLDLDGGVDWSAADAGTASTVQALAGMTPLVAPGFLGLFSGDPFAARYVAFDPATGAVRWAYAFAGDTIGFAAQPVLTATGSTLAFTESPGQFRLTEIASDGGELFTCVLPRPASLGSPALRHGRLTIQSAAGPSVQSFELPGYEPASHGWVTSGGKMTREGHPR